MPAVMRASAIIEKAGVPAVAVGSAHFEVLGHATAKIMGVPHVPIISYPGVPLSDTSEEFNRKVTDVVAPAVIEALIEEPARDGQVDKAPERDGQITREVVFRGSLDEIHDHFLGRAWTDGLPIMPPTLDRVEAFLRHTDRDPAEILGVLLPARQEATVWNVAVNGVMAGCAATIHADTSRRRRVHLRPQLAHRRGRIDARLGADRDRQRADDQRVELQLRNSRPAYRPASE